VRERKKRKSRAGEESEREKVREKNYIRKKIRRKQGKGRGM